MIHQQTGPVNYNSIDAVIEFIVDNNPNGVADAVQRQGYSLRGLNLDEIKQYIYDLHQHGYSIGWLLDVKYNSSAPNYTGSSNFNNTKSRGVSWDTVGQVLTSIGSIATGIMAGKGGSQSTPAAPETILGFDKEVFYGLAIVTVIILALTAFVLFRKK